MQEPNNEIKSGSRPERIDLMALFSDLWRGLKRWFWVGIAAAVLFSGLFSLKTKLTWKPLYQSSATFVISLGTDYGTSSRYYTVAAAEQMDKTFPYILKSGILNSIVANDLGLSYVPGNITATSVTATGLFTLNVTASDPQMSYDILQSVMRNYPQVASFVVGDTVLTLMGETGVPEDPVNPISYRRDVMKGVLLGALLCGALVAAYAVLHKTVRRPGDIRRLINTKCIGLLPHVNRKKWKSESTMLLSNPQMPGSFRESVHRLRTRVENKNVHTLLVTSALAGEGKTTVAANLAFSLAEKGHFVLLIDTDLRSPAVEKLLGTHHRYGISDYLEGKAEFNQIGFVFAQYKNFGVIPAGQPTRDASEKMQSPRMKELVRQAQEMAEYVILDCSPSAFLTDSALMASYADAALLVVRQDYASVDRILSGVEALSDSGTPLLGCVLNDMPRSMLGKGSSYGGSYGYGSYGSYGAVKE